MTWRWWRRTAQPDPDAVPNQTGPATVPGPDAVRPDLLAWAQEVDVSRLSDRTVHWAEDYLQRYRRMNLDARQEEAFRLLAAIKAQVSPQPPITIHPMDVIATVLAVRRQQLGIG